MFNQSKAFAIGLLVAVFVAGVAAGVAGTRWDLGRRAAARREGRGYVERLAQQVRLTATQRDSVTGILKRYDPLMREIFARVRPQMDSLRERLRADIRAQLTASQQAAYQQLIDRDRARYQRRDSAGQRTDRKNDD